MLRKRSFIRKSNSGCEDIHHSCTVRFLDEREPLTVTFSKSSPGQELIDQVCSALDLIERDYFGLRFVDAEKQRHWLDASKTAFLQLKNVKPLVLCFRVKFYPSDPMKLKEEITKYYIYLQLCRDLHHGRLLCTVAEANQLAAYIVQAELGDSDSQQSPELITQIKMLPKQCQKQEAAIQELHKQLSGQSPGEIEASFLEMTSKLDTYGVDPHPVRDTTGVQMYLGVTHQGIVTFQGNKRVHLFTWPHVTKLDIEGKQFIVHVTQETELGLDVVNDVAQPTAATKPLQAKKRTTVPRQFKCPSTRACKHLWKCCVEQQYFFTLQSSQAAPKVTAGRGLFRRGSVYRFSGHCEKEAFNEGASITREAPAFARSSSNLHLARSSSANISGYQTLPAGFKTSDMDSSAASGMDGDWSNLSADNGFKTDSIREEQPVEISELNYSPVESPDTEALPPFPRPLGQSAPTEALRKEFTGIRRSPGVREALSVVCDAATANKQEVGDKTITATTADLDAQIRELQLELEKCRNAAAVSTAQSNDISHPVPIVPVPLSDARGGLGTADRQGKPTWNGGSGIPAAQGSSLSNKPRPAHNVLRRVLFAILAAFIVILLILVLLYETKMAIPLVENLREMTAVKQFGRDFYRPFKKSIVG